MGNHCKSGAASTIQIQILCGEAVGVKVVAEVCGVSKGVSRGVCRGVSRGVLTPRCAALTQVTVHRVVRVGADRCLWAVDTRLRV